MIKVGITGQSGFIGSHLYNTLGLHSNKFKRIPFKKEYFNDEKHLRDFINSKFNNKIDKPEITKHLRYDIIFTLNFSLRFPLILSRVIYQISYFFFDIQLTSYGNQSHLKHAIHCTCR